MTLELTRRCGESISVRVPGLDDPIRITFVGWHGRQVRLAFDAPPHVLILRDELEERQIEDLRAAAPQKGTRENFSEPSSPSPAAALSIVTRLDECMKASRVILGEKYAARMEELQGVIRLHSTRTGRPPLDCAIDLAGKLTERGEEGLTIQLFAAWAEGTASGVFQ